jgi:hypothetical protein
VSIRDGLIAASTLDGADVGQGGRGKLAIGAFLRLINSPAPHPHVQAVERSEICEKLKDVVGLCADPPEHAVVLSVDEKSQAQALDRTQPRLPVKLGRTGTMTHETTNVTAPPPCSPPSTCSMEQSIGRRQSREYGKFAAAVAICWSTF